MLLLQLIPCLLLFADWSEAKGVVAPPVGVVAAPGGVIATSGVVAPSGGGVSKQHRQQDDYGNYNFAYEVQDPTSHQFRKETGDAYGRIVGSYGLSEIDGRQRIVDYVADEYGFRAKVRTNEPGTGAENSAAVEVLKPGHPPAPPRIPAISRAPPPPPPPPPPPLPPAPPRRLPGVTSTGKSVPSAQVPLSGNAPPPYIQHPPPYGHPYYYTPIKSSFGNAIYSSPQTRQSLYIPQPQAQDSYDRYDKYKPPANVQSFYPVPPPIKEQSQKYLASIYDITPLQTHTDLSLPSDVATRSKSRHGDTRLPSNYRVVHIPNGIQAVPIDGPNPPVDIRDQSPYQYPISNFPREAAYPSGRNPVYLGFKSGQKSFVDSPRDYSFAGTSEEKSIAAPEKEESDES